MTYKIGDYLIPFIRPEGATITKITNVGPIGCFECLYYWWQSTSVGPTIGPTIFDRRLRIIEYITLDDKHYVLTYKMLTVGQLQNIYSSLPARDDEIALFEKIYLVHKMQEIIET